MGKTVTLGSLFIKVYKFGCAQRAAAKDMETFVKKPDIDPRCHPTPGFHDVNRSRTQDSDRERTKFVPYLCRFTASGKNETRANWHVLVSFQNEQNLTHNIKDVYLYLVSHISEIHVEFIG